MDTPKPGILVDGPPRRQVLGGQKYRLSFRVPGAPGHEQGEGQHEHQGPTHDGDGAQPELACPWVTTHAQVSIPAEPSRIQRAQTIHCRAHYE